MRGRENHAEQEQRSHRLGTLLARACRTGWNENSEGRGHQSQSARCLHSLTFLCQLLGSLVVLRLLLGSKG
jgi:hypothetical protein